MQGAGPVNVNASLSNVKVTGFGAAKVIYNKVDPVTYDFHTKLLIPRLRIEGKYILLGRILVIPLRGEGSCWFDARNLNSMKVQTNMSLYKKIVFLSENLDIYVKSDVNLQKTDEFHIFNITAVHVKFSIGGLKFRLNNLFDGIKALGNIITLKVNCIGYMFVFFFRGNNEYLFERKLAACC